MPSYQNTIAQPVTFPSGRTAPNRMLKGAMTERLCTYHETDLDQRGKPTPEYINLYKTWGEGAIGIIVLGNIPISRISLEAKGNAIIDKDSPWDPVHAFKPVIAAAKKHGSLVIGQLTHGGRQTTSDINPHPVSSSDTQHFGAAGLEFAPARALKLEEIKDIVDRYGYGAEVLYKAGADGAQLHSAHGYLLSQFLSPKINKRTDAYGGSLENRSRIVFEIITEIRRRVPDPTFIISIKYNSHDYIEGGFSEEDSEKMAVKMEQAGVELIELSGGTYESQSVAFRFKEASTKRREAFFIEFAERIRPHLTNKSRLCVTGGFRSSSAMVSALESNVCDIIGLGRPLCSETDLCAKLISGKSSAAKENKVDIALQIAAAFVQEARIGRGMEPLDFANEDDIKAAVNKLLGTDDVSWLKEKPKAAVTEQVVEPGRAKV